MHRNYPTARLQRLCALCRLCTRTQKRPRYFSGNGVKTIARPSSPETGFCLCACSERVMQNNTGDSRNGRFFAECVRNMVTAFASRAWQKDYRHNWIFKVKRGGNKHTRYGEPPFMPIPGGYSLQVQFLPSALLYYSHFKLFIL